MHRGTAARDATAERSLLRPAPVQVTVYLAAHSLESTIEEAVNDAVLKQVKVCCSCHTSKRGAHALTRRVLLCRIRSGTLRTSC